MGALTASIAKTVAHPIGGWHRYRNSRLIRVVGHGLPSKDDQGQMPLHIGTPRWHK